MIDNLLYPMILVSASALEAQVVLELGCQGNHSTARISINGISSMEFRELKHPLSPQQLPTWLLVATQLVT